MGYHYLFSDLKRVNAKKKKGSMHTHTFNIDLELLGFRLLLLRMILLPIVFTLISIHESALLIFSFPSL